MGPSLAFKSGFVCQHTSTEATQKLFLGQIIRMQVLHFPNSCQRCVGCCSTVSQVVFRLVFYGDLAQILQILVQGVWDGSEILHFSHAPWWYHCFGLRTTFGSEILCYWGKHSRGFLRTVLVLVLKVRGKSRWLVTVHIKSLALQEARSMPTQ